MSAHVLLNLLNKLRKIDKMRSLSSIYSFSQSLINSIKQEHEFRFYLSHDIKINTNHIFGVKSSKF